MAKKTHPAIQPTRYRTLDLGALPRELQDKLLADAEALMRAMDAAFVAAVGA